jgi:hypothetical protein
MEITIKGNTVSLKYSFRALMIYENITQKSFNPKGISDVVVFFYSVVVASTKDTTLSFDDFIDWLDDNATAINDFSVWLTSVFNAQSGLVNKEVQPEEQTTVDEKN